MRNDIIAILCFSVLLQGCYSSLALDENEMKKGRPTEAEGVVVTLSNGSEIDVEPYHHLNVTEPSDLLYGVGRRTHRYTGEETEFAGKLTRSSRDSVKIVKIGSLNNVTCYLPDSTQIQFQGKDNVIVTPDLGTGFFCAGIQKIGDNVTVFNGKILSQDIRRMEVIEFSSARTSQLGLTIAGSGVTILLVTNRSPVVMNCRRFFW